ncbi:hypothetical protein G6F22_021948 [Rhizopus arrhizus]|nr:hypothetical protein G6F22_021948 [Rhizopus arrhizus]
MAGAAVGLQRIHHLGQGPGWRAAGTAHCPSAQEKPGPGRWTAGEWPAAAARCRPGCSGSAAGPAAAAAIAAASPA